MFLLNFPRTPWPPRGIRARALAFAAFFGQSAETSVIPTLGFEFDFSISNTFPTFLMLRPSVSYFMDSSSSETSVKLSDQSGYGADLDITLKKEKT